jgi:signal transduction histidine kinase
MTITTGGTHTILTFADPVQADTQQTWDLAVGHDPAAIARPEPADDGAADGFASPHGQRVAARSTAHGAVPGPGTRPVALGGLAGWTARRDPAGWMEGRVSLPGDDEQTRHNKVLFTSAVILVTPAMLVWAGLYFAYREPVAAVIPVFFAAVTLAGSVALFRFRRFAPFWWTELVVAFANSVAVQFILGGFVASGAVILWALLPVVAAVMFGRGREAWWWFSAFVIAVGMAAVLQPRLQVTSNMPAWLVMFFFVLNMVGVSAVTFIVLRSFTRDRRRLRELEVSYLNQEVMLRQGEKLATLGTLAAGVAHELNNPAAAALRGAAQLRPLLEGMQSAYLELCAASSPQLSAAIERAGELIQRGSGQVVSLSPLDRSDRVEEMAGWLRGVGVEQPADAARALVDLGHTRVRLEELTSAVPQANMAGFLSWLARADEARRLVAEVGEGAGRISQIVGAMRSYAYLDQAPVQEVDITEGLESTLVLLGSRLKPGVAVRRQYAEHLPRIQAHGSELNQVWTSIIENAIDAMSGHGTLTVRTAARDGYVLAEIEDNGPGMPPEVAARVFDPFFTTKPPGQGTGLGLNISHNIVVQEHKGRIEVDPKPGRTTFRVFLPIAVPPDLPVRPHRGSGGRTSPPLSPLPPRKRPA